MRLYKFVASRNAVLNIAKGSLKFTPINELNDPSEFTAILNRDAVKASLQSLRAQGLTQDQFDWLLRQSATLDVLAPEEKVIDAPQSLSEANRMLSMAIYQNLDYMESKLFATIKLIRDRVGVLSLTARCDSLPMWAHYANEGKGFVVALEGLERTFPGDETGSLNIPKAVEYFNDFLGMTYDPSTQDRLFLSKHTDWAYEREWRIVTPLKSCTKSPDGTLFLRHVPPECLHSVICGYSTSKEDIEGVRDELKSIAPTLRFMTTAISAGKVTFTPC